MTRALLVFLSCCAAEPCAAQVSTYALGTPDGTLAEPFSVIRGARELSSGRVLVTDWVEQKLVLADYGRGEVLERGRTGGGPQEFRLPGALLPFRGDSTLLVDAGNQRVAVLDGGGVIRRFLRAPVTAARSPFGGDGLGRVYFSIPPWLAERPLAGDSLQLAVWDPSTDAIRVLATVHGWTPSKQKPGEGPRIPYVVFAPQDTWAVSGTGRLAIVRGGSYGVEWIDERGTQRGPRITVRPVAATSADRRNAARLFAANAAVGGRNADGGSGISAASADTRTERAVAELERASTFAESLPSFRSGSAVTDAAGRVWVARWERTGQPVVYDVFSATGTLVAQVRLRPGQRIAAVGRAHAYVVRTDRDDLEWLERHPLPTPLRRAAS